MMKSGSGASGKLGNFYPEGAISPSYSDANTNPEFFSIGVAITQSIDPAGFPSNAWWYPFTSSVYDGGWLNLITDATTTYPGSFPGTIQGLGNIYFYNNKTGGYSQEPLNTREETLLPLQEGDTIRVGTTSSIDTSTRASGIGTISALEGLRTMAPVYSDEMGPSPLYTPLTFRLQQISWPFGMSGSLLAPLPEVEGLTDSNTYDKQAFRVIRRIPTEFYILLKNRPTAFAGEGLLLPRNFDPKYNARKVAKGLGVI